MYCYVNVLNRKRIFITIKGISCYKKDIFVEIKLVQEARFISLAKTVQIVDIVFQTLQDGSCGVKIIDRKIFKIQNNDIILTN